jgi:CheY-like chemotaxis protein
MGARLEVRSSPGAGTAFSYTVLLPRADPHAETETIRLAILEQGYGHARDAQASGAQPHHHAGRRLLLVDDNEVNRELALGMLEIYGVDVDCAEDGQQALEHLGQARYDLVLMDCHMPRLDGYAATREWRDREQLDGRARTPIVALTAAALPGDREKCAAAGMDDYLTKPFTRDMLDEALGRWLPVAPAARSTLEADSP